MSTRPVLVVGLFNNDKKIKRNYISAAEQLAEILTNNNIPVIRTSSYRGKLFRLIDTVYAILTNCIRIDIAIVPLYGTKPSFIWQEIATRLLKLFHKNVILVVHGGSVPRRMDEDAAPFLKALHRADIVVCPSGYLQQYLYGHGIPTVLIENVLDLSEYIYIKKNSVAPHIIWMRAFEDVYNPEMAIRVAVLLSKKYPNLAMVMAGKDEGMLNEMKKLSKRNQLENKITFPGYINIQQKLRYAQTHDIYICTNRVDNAPVSLIEFMALGLPIVAVNTGGIPYLIKDGYNGLLVNLDDDEAMVNKIEMLIENPALSSSISRNAYNYSRQYGEKVVIKKWKEVLEQLNEKI